MESKTINYPFRNPNLPFKDRVIDLIARLTLEEKISQLRYRADSIPRLDIPEYNYWSEALHGIARNGLATIFPQAIGMSATWDRNLIYQIASAIGDEARAKYHEVIRRKGKSDIYQGLTFWSPNINIFRDPRWGRGQETWGEDPYLTGELSSAFVRGLQGDHPKYLKAAACAKHFAVHSGPEGARHIFNAVVSPQDLFNTYLPAFKKLVTEAKVEAVMGAYNRTLGEPCCASQYLLEDILRGEWDFQGHFVSDCGALSDIHKNHKITRDAAESAALAIKAGCDLACDEVYDSLPEAIERGLIDESFIDRALSRVLLTRFKLGLFDPAELVPFSLIPMSIVNCEQHRTLSRLAGQKSIVLLKNKDHILPISEDIQSIFITGPGAANLDILLGNYHGISEDLVSLLVGITTRIPEGTKTEYRPGCQWTTPNTQSLNWAVHEANKCELTIVCAGTCPLMEGEEGESILNSNKGDRKKIGLPYSQVKYIRQLAGQSTKIILVLSGGSPIALNDVEDLVDAILVVWYPGQEGGNALADILFGDTSPSGKLPISFPRSISQLPRFTDYSMKNRTYRYSKEVPLYPFGFGLSYTQFEYRNLLLNKKVITLEDSLQATFDLKNVGEVFGDEVVQVYLSALEATEAVPKHSLIDFVRISLKQGETKSISFTITPENMSYYGSCGSNHIYPGRYRVEIGGCSPGKRGQQLGAPIPVHAEFTVK